MSGGHFDHQQYRLHDIAEEIIELINNNKIEELNEFGYPISLCYPPDIIEKFKETVAYLKRAESMVQRVDWLVSGDDGEDSFRKRWKKEVKDLKDYIG